MSYLFDCYAGIYDCFMNIFHLNDTSHIEAQLENHVYQILDVGGGSGTLADHLQRQGHQVTILDSSLPMLKQARRKNENVQLIHASLLDYPMLSKYDVIICRDCFHHFMYQEKCLDIMLDSIKDDGFLLIHEFHPQSKRIQCLFLFERCCFEKIYPMTPCHLEKMCNQRHLDFSLIHLGRWDYICKIKSLK